MLLMDKLPHIKHHQTPRVYQLVQPQVLAVTSHQSSSQPKNGQGHPLRNCLLASGLLKVITSITTIEELSVLSIGSRVRVLDATMGQCLQIHHTGVIN